MKVIENNIDIKGSANKSLSVTIEENVTLKVIQYTPDKPVMSKSIILITGLATLLEDFYDMLAFLVQRAPLIYIDTREKRSSQIVGNASYGIETQGLDLAKIVRCFGLKEKDYFMMGYSFGATIIADSYRSLKSKPKGIIFLEPTPVFHYPNWSLFLINHFGSRLYCILKPIAKWYLGNFYINKNEDSEMAAISSRALDNANPDKLRKVILDIAGYEVWDMLGFIDCKTLVVGTSKDGLHIQCEIERMMKMIKNAEFLDLETNLRTHSTEMGELAFRFFQRVNQ